jgi:hypothetical protein
MSRSSGPGDIMNAHPSASGGLMLSILNVTAPFFALIACGYGAHRVTGCCRRTRCRPSTPSVLYFALPCMMFRFTLETPIAQIFSVRVFLAVHDRRASHLRDFRLRLQLRHPGAHCM